MTNTILPATYDLTIAQRATFRQQFTLGFDCTNKTVLAQVWNDKRTEKIFDFTVTWIDRAEVCYGGTKGRFDLSATDAQTALLLKPGKWDLLVVDDASDEREYYLEGSVFINEGFTEEGA